MVMVSVNTKSRESNSKKVIRESSSGEALEGTQYKQQQGISKQRGYST
jgi:hypothetical protein